MKASLKAILLIIVIASATSTPATAKPTPEKTEEQGYVEPFKMFDNLYYVGDRWTSAYLLKTTKGLVLIDTLDMPYSKWIPENISLLGFTPTDINYILVTHPHSDHAAGAGYLQRTYQAKVIMLEEGVGLLEAQSHKHGFIKPTIDMFPSDAQELNLDGLQIKVYQTPGHTKGCMSMIFDVFDKGARHQALVVCGNGTNFKGQELALEYVSSMQKIKEKVKATPQITVNLPTHPHLGQIFERKLTLLNTAKNPYVDRQGLMYFLNLLEQRGKKKLLIESKNLSLDLVIVKNKKASVLLLNAGFFGWEINYFSLRFTLNQYVR